MNIVFMGTPEYVIRPLESLLTSDHAEIAGVYSQPNRPVGRGGVMTPPRLGSIAGSVDFPCSSQPAYEMHRPTKNLLT